MKQASYILFLFLVMYSLSKAQTDSAKYYLKSKLPVMLRIKKTMVAARISEDKSDPLVYFNKLTAIPEIGKSDEHFGYASTHLAEAYAVSGDMKKALEILKTAASKGTVTDTLAANIYGFISFLHFSLGEYEPAVSFCMKSVDFAEKTGKNRIKGPAYNTLGLIFAEKTPPDYQKALEYYLKSETLLKPYNIPRNMGLIYLRLGNVLTHLSKYEAAEEYLNKALKIGDSTNLVEIQKWTLETYGKLYMKSGNTKKALPIIKRSFEMSEKMKDFIGMASSAYELSNTYYSLKDFKNAARYADTSIAVSSRIQQLNILHQALGLRADIYENEGDFRNALNLFKKNKMLLDSISKTESVKNINELEQKYKTQKQQKELAEKEGQLLVQQTEMKQQRQQRNYFVGGLILLSLFLVFVYRGYKNKVRTSKVLAEKNHLIEEKNREILDSINYAKRIQTAILPPQKQVKEYLPDSFIFYKPKDIVAGDFYWMEHTGTSILFAAADCTGHGVPGAMVSVVCHNALNRSIREYRLTDPGKILDKTREIVLEEFEKSEEDVKDGMDISICALNMQTRKLLWAGANNPLWIIRAASAEVEEVKANKQPVGKHTDHADFTTHAIQLNKGDSVYVFTDGFQDQFGGEKGKKYKAGKIKEMLLTLQKRSMEEQRTALEKEFVSWQGKHEQVDDVTFIGIRV